MVGTSTQQPMNVSNSHVMSSLNMSWNDDDDHHYHEGDSDDMECIQSRNHSNVALLFGRCNIPPPPSPISVLGARPLIETSSSTKQVSIQIQPLSSTTCLQSYIDTYGGDDDVDNHYTIDYDDLDLDEQWIIPSSTMTTMTNNHNGCHSPSISNTSINGFVCTISHHPEEIMNDTHQSISSVDEWKISRYSLIQQQRLSLCRQRVHLQRRFMETKFKQQRQQKMEHTPLLPCTIYRNNQHSTKMTQPYHVLWSGGIDDNQKLPTGWGKMIFTNHNQVYVGQCQNGLRDGIGRNEWTTHNVQQQQIYIGEWKCNQRHGRGTHTWSDGRSVTGNWVRGHLHGRIVFTWPDGSTYDGYAKLGQKHGRGTHTWSNGRTYIGQYDHGYEHGIGMLTEPHQNSKYRGQFQKGTRHGYGIQFWPTKTYEGEWYHNQVHGEGKLIWRHTGASYVGEFQHGLYHGIGIYKDGTKCYIGQWCDGMKEGDGKASWSDGRAYEGQFHKNKRHGYGHMVYTDRYFYVGGWKHGKRCGQGIGIYGNGIVHHCGMWINDVPYIEERQHTNRTVTLDDLSLTTQRKVTSADVTIHTKDYSLDDSDLDLFNNIMRSNLLEL